jgi:alkanesulfonate monooxygenase SsuD/methylene tetrahydromethanopterin reductase-like flavin-dependent oxidoreductase (luciferase family)
MSTAVAQPRAAGEEPNGKRAFKLGFHTRISFPTGRAADGLRDGIELFRAGEQLGYDAGWAYQRHFDNYMAAPLVFLPVVAQHTTRITLGTAIVGMRYEAPILMAEAAGTADLLTNGRLQLGLGTGMGGFDVVFAQEPNDGRDQSQAKLELFMRGIRGEPVGVVNEPAGMLTAGVQLTVRPTSPTLPERVWYGAGSVASAERIGRQGLRLMTSTILTGRFDDYGVEQARLIEAYRDAYTGSTPPRVAVSRSILPTTSAESGRRYAAYDHERRMQGPGASRPEGALNPTAELAAAAFTVSQSIRGEPEAVAEALLSDPAVALADEVIAFLPPAFDLEHNRRLIEEIAEMAAGRLGWHPAEPMSDQR